MSEQEVKQADETISRRPSAVRLANRSLLLLVLFAGSLVPLLTPLGMSEGAAFCLNAFLLIGVLQYLLRGTADSPLELLKRYREVSLPTVAGLAALVFVIEAGLLNFSSAFTPALYAVDIVPFEDDASSALEFLLTIVGVAAFVPFYEELVFRGLALRAYQGVRSLWFAVLFTSALFGLVHGTLIDAFVFFPAFVLVALAVLKTGQLWNAVLVHAFGNLVATLLQGFDTSDAEALAATPTEGVVGLVVAAAAFYLGFRWLRPGADVRREGEKGSIWTFSLVAVLVVVVLLNLMTTLEALEPVLDSFL